MRAEYKRDLQNNYLILEAEENREDYGLIMAEENHVKGLLPLHCSRQDGKLFLHYEITSKQTIDNLYESKAMRYQDIWMLLAGIRDTMEDMQQYLLTPDRLLFAPDMIYALPDRGGIFLCYYSEADVCPITLLAEFLLKHLDHEDPRAVSLGYGFYQRASAGNFGLSDALKEILSTAGKEKEEPEKFPAPEVPVSERPESGSESLPEENRNDDDEVEEFHVVHQERKHREEKSSGKSFFKILHPIVLASFLFLIAALGGSFYLKLIGLREAGGCFFLLLASEMLLNSLLLRRSKKEEKSWEEEEETEEYQHLLRQMYQDENVEEEAEEIKETCFLLPDREQVPLSLVYTGGETAGTVPPEIVPGRTAIQLGKLKGETDVLLDARTVSRVHARIELRGESCFVKDLNSKNGTFVNGRRLQPQEECEIREGDTVTFAELCYRAVSAGKTGIDS